MFCTCAFRHPPLLPIYQEIDAEESTTVGPSTFINHPAVENMAILNLSADPNGASTICRPQPVHLGRNRPQKSQYPIQLRELFGPFQQPATDLIEQVEGKPGQLDIWIGRYDIVGWKTMR